MADIHLENISKQYGKNAALNDVSLEVPDGHAVVLLGPSGCGKTTLLRCVAGLERVNSGQIMIGGSSVNDLTPRERDLSMVFQNYALFPLLTAFDNIGFPLKIRGKSKAEITARVKEVAKTLQIENLLDKTPRQLSGGEQQRVAIGRAIARQPRAFLLDEPLSNLDAPTRIQLRAELKKIQKSLGVTTIYVTHDQSEAMALADKIGVMRGGKILQYDSPETIYSNPENLFVASFVGTPTMNIADVKLVKENGSSFLKGPGVTYPLSSQRAQRVESAQGSGDMVLGIRSEDLRVGNGSLPPAGPKVADGEVEIIESFGAFKLVEMEISPDVTFRVTLPIDSKIAVGDHVSLTVSNDRIHVFDKSSGKAVI
jgi:multiple sugar transport system ATP-binding protein